jgi:hypothetical protein
MESAVKAHLYPPCFLVKVLQTVSPSANAVRSFVHLDITGTTSKELCFSIKVDEGTEAVENALQSGRNGVDDPAPRQALKDICFAIMVANKNEWDSAMHFLGVEGRQVAELVKPRTCTAADADDSLKEVKFIGRIGSEIYDVLSVGNKKGIIFKCSQMGSMSTNASNHETTNLLERARIEKWPLKVIFVIGCCGAAGRKEGVQGAMASVLNGSVFVANFLYPYAGKFESKVKVKLDPRPMSKHWNSLLTKVPGKGGWEIKSIDLVPFYSGDFVMKNHEITDDLSAALESNKVGFEMEGLGVVMAPLDSVKLALVKGVSDSAGSDKNAKAPIRFFSQYLADVDEDTRQQMCTMMSLALVLRAIAADKKDLCPR